VKPQDLLKARTPIAIFVSIALMTTTLLIWRGRVWRPERMPAGRFPEQLVYVRADDDVVDGGVMFMPPKQSAESTAIIWIHGWGVNFYHPAYVKIGRALAERGYTCINANTRMHDIGFNIGETETMRVRGGGYWGVPSEQVRDLAAWIDFAADRGFKQVVLVGHSAGWAAVRLYQSEKKDKRVVGLVLASGGVRPGDVKPDSEMLEQATHLVVEGHGDDLLRIPNRRFPSFISAATYLDEAGTPQEQNDFFGIHTPNPAVTRIRCPILAFFGTNGDVGTEADLKLLQSSIHRQRSGPSRVDIAMIKRADHMYTGEEAQVAQIISQWADSLSSVQQ
jgi:pimeloyl-ACP methyl ester carboxylesterase